MPLSTSFQLRAARALLGWDQKMLAEKAGVGVATVRRLEVLHGPLDAQTGTVRKLEAALEEAGLELFGDGKPGVRVR